MTLAELKALIDTLLPDNMIGLITEAKIRQAMKAIADFVVSSQGEADTAPFVYDSGFSYDTGDPVIYDSAWYLSLVDTNLNNTPDSSPTEWDPVNAFNTVLSIWEQDAVYLGELTIVIKDNKLYLLDRDSVGSEPYVSSDFATELAAGDWINLLPDTTPVANTYADSATMIAAQWSQVSGYFYKAGTSLYFYLGTTVGNITDYYEVSGSAGTPTPPVANTYADTATMIAGQGSQITNYIYQAGTDFYRYKGTTVGDLTDYVQIGGFVASFIEASHREDATVLFDGPYISGINSTALSGDIDFDFTGAKLGAWTIMRHADASAFTFDDNSGNITFKFLFDSADISTSADNYFLFTLVDKTTDAEIVIIQHQLEGS